MCYLKKDPGYYFPGSSQSIGFLYWGKPLISYLNTLPPNIRVNTNSIIKIQKNTFAIEAAPAAIPPNPKTAAIIAITTKIIAHLSIIISFCSLQTYKITCQNLTEVKILQKLKYL